MAAAVTERDCTHCASDLILVREVRAQGGDKPMPQLLGHYLGSPLVRNEPKLACAYAFKIDITVGSGGQTKTSLVESPCTANKDLVGSRDACKIKDVSLD